MGCNPQPPRRRTRDTSRRGRRRTRSPTAIADTTLHYSLPRVDVIAHAPPDHAAAVRPWPGLAILRLTSPPQQCARSKRQRAVRQPEQATANGLVVFLRPVVMSSKRSNGPVVDGRATVSFCAWLAWSRYSRPLQSDPELGSRRAGPRSGASMRRFGAFGRFWWTWRRRPKRSGRSSMWWAAIGRTLRSSLGSSTAGMAPTMTSGRGLTPTRPDRFGSKDSLVRSPCPPDERSRLLQCRRRGSRITGAASGGRGPQAEVWLAGAEPVRLLGLRGCWSDNLTSVVVPLRRSVRDCSVVDRRGCCLCRARRPANWAELRV
jgi:hypothetical protein